MVSISSVSKRHYKELYDDEDEVLICIAEAIPTLIDLIGGPSSYYVLLEPLEKLMQVEEPAIRDKVSKCFQNVQYIIYIFKY